MIEQQRAQQQPLQIENRLQQALYSPNMERALSDKVLAQKDIDAIRDIIRRDRLGLADLRELAYNLGATEVKLINLDLKERYLLGKYLTWAYQVVQIQETHIKNKEILSKKDVTPLTMETNNMVYEILDEEIKKMVNIYLYLGRSSLSLKGEAFSRLLTNKFDYQYKQDSLIKQDDGGKSIFNFKGS